MSPISLNNYGTSLRPRSRESDKWGNRLSQRPFRLAANLTLLFGITLGASYCIAFELQSKQANEFSSNDQSDEKRGDSKPPEPQSVEKIEVKASQDSYDPRQDDTAAKIVVGQKEISKFGDTQLADVLKRLPGITVVGGDVRMRGIGSGYTQILIDGEKVSQGFSIDSLSPDSVEQIEILRSASASQSTQSIAGTINFVLKKKVVAGQRDVLITGRSSRDINGSTINLTISDKNATDKGVAFSYTATGSLNINRATNNFPTDTFWKDALGNLTFASTDNNRFVGNQTSGNFAPRFNWVWASGDTLSAQSFVNFNRISSTSDRNYLTLAGFPTTYASIQTSVLFELLNSRTDLNWLHKLANGAKLEMKAGLSTGRGRNDYNRQGFDVSQTHNLDSVVNSESTENGVSLSGRYSLPFIEKHSIITGWDGGINWRHENRDQRDKPLPAAPNPIVSYEDFLAKVSRLALFSQDEWYVSDYWSIYLGIRWESLYTSSEGKLFARLRNNLSVWSPILQTLYKFPERKGEQIRLAISRTYRPPSTPNLIPRRVTSPINSATDPDRQGNPNLLPELATGIDVAYEKFWTKGAMVSLAAAFRRISNFNLDDLQFTNGRWVLSPVNSGIATVKSLEFDSKLPLQEFASELPPLDMRFNLGKNWSAVSAVPGPFNRLAQQTPFSATAGLDYRVKGGEWAVGTSYTFLSGGPVRTGVNRSSWTKPLRGGFASLGRTN